MEKSNYSLAKKITLKNVTSGAVWQKFFLLYFVLLVLNNPQNAQYNQQLFYIGFMHLKTLFNHLNVMCDISFLT